MDIKILVDKTDYELLNIASCITYDNNLHKILSKYKLKAGDEFILENKESNEYVKLFVGSIDFDNTFWLTEIL